MKKSRKMLQSENLKIPSAVDMNDVPNEQCDGQVCLTHFVVVSVV